MNFALIVAHDKKHGIGCDNKIPWRVKEDTKFFRQTTVTVNDKQKKNLLLMGRRTYESLPKGGLTGRFNLVITSKQIPEVNCVSSLEKALEYIEKNVYFIETIFIIGGEQLYNSFCREHGHLINTFYITTIKDEWPCDRDVRFLHKYRVGYAPRMIKETDDCLIMRHDK